MKLGNRNIAQKTVAYLSLILVVLLLCNNAIYLHTHKLASGEVIVHAHPFNKAENSDNSSTKEPHQHTKAEFLFLANLSLLFPILFLLFSIVKAEKKKWKLKLLNNSYSFAYQFVINGRAPPALARI